MSAPNANASAVKLIGQGYRMRARSASLKWGIQSTESINLTSIKDYTYNHDQFLNMVPGSVSLAAYEKEADRWPRVDTPLGESQSYDKAEVDSHFNDETTLGVAYLESGIDEELRRDSGQSWTLYSYEPSSVEFYSYHVPNVLKILPSAGFSKGGTFVEVLGTWFDY